MDEINKLILPVMGQPELTSINARDDEKETYRRAYKEQQEGILTPADYMDQGGRMYGIKRQEGLTGPMVPVVPTGPEGLIVNQRAEQIANPRSMTVEQIIKSGSPVTENREYMESMAAELMPEYARQRELAEKYAGVTNGTKTYDEFLIEAYGRDALKASGYHTDSVAYWKSQFREGNYQHPLDNKVLRQGIINTADQLFQLETFYDMLTGDRRTDGLAELVGKELDEEGYRAAFGDDWDKLIERVGDYEQAVRFFKAGYLGDAVNQLIYEEYDAEGEGVGDPKYYVDNAGTLFEIVENNGQDIDKSRQMYLMKNADGSFDRLTQMKNEFGEFWGAMGNGFVGALTGILDVLGAGLLLATTGTKQLLGLSDRSFKDEFLEKYTEFYAWMNNNARSPLMKVHDLDADGWDSSNIARGVGTAIGYVTEIALEIFLMAGVGKLAQTLSKGGQEVLEKGVAKAASGLGGKIVSKIGNETLEAGTKKLSKEAVEKIMKEVAEEYTEAELKAIGLQSIFKEATEEAGKKAISEAIEKMADEVGEAGIKEVLVGGVKTQMFGFADDAMKQSALNILNKKFMVEVKKEAAIKSLGRNVSRFMVDRVHDVFKLSNHMKMLNSGAISFAPNIFAKIASKRWASTLQRASVNFVLTAFETGVNQYARAQYDTKLTEDIIWRNLLLAGGVTAASTLFLSSSIDDYDNIARFTPESAKSEAGEALVKARMFLMSAGTERAAITDEMLKDTAAKLFKKSSQEVLDKISKFNIGKYMLGQNTARFFGGVFEFVDNVLTMSVRNAANLGVKHIGGDDGLFNFKNMITPDVLFPAFLSSAKSALGRRNLFGLAGENEGSINNGAAAAKAAGVKMYMDIAEVLNQLEIASKGTIEHEAILRVQNEISTTFAKGLKDYKDPTYAALDVLDMLARKSGTDPDVVKSLDKDFMGRIAKTEAFKTAAKNGAFNKMGIVDKHGELRGDFSFGEYINRSFGKDKMEQDLAFMRSVIAKYELRKMLFDKATDERKSKNISAVRKHIGEAIRHFFSPTKITQSAEVTQMKPMLDQALRYYGYDFSGKEITDQQMDAFVAHSMLQQVKYDRALSQEHNYNASGERIKRHMAARYLSEGFVSSLKIYTKIHSETSSKFGLDALATSQAFADAKAVLSSGATTVKAAGGTFANGDAVDFIVKSAQAEMKILSGDKYVLTAGDIDQIAANAALSDNPTATLKTNMKHGYVIYLFDNGYNQGSANQDDINYKKNVTAALSVIAKLNAQGGKGSQDFVILGKPEDGRVFVAATKDTDNVVSAHSTYWFVGRMIQDMAVIQNPKSSDAGVLAALQSFTQFIGHDTTTYVDLDTAFKAANSPSGNPNEFISGVRLLLDSKLISTESVFNAVVRNEDNNELMIQVRKIMSSKSNVDTGTFGTLFELKSKFNELNELLSSNEITEARFSKLAILLNAVTGPDQSLAKFLGDKENEGLRRAIGLDDAKTKALEKLLANLKAGGVEPGKPFRGTQAELESLAKVLHLYSPAQGPLTREGFISELRKQSTNNAADNIVSSVGALRKKQTARTANADQLRNKLVDSLESPTSRSPSDPREFSQELMSELETAIRAEVSARPDVYTVSEIDAGIDDAEIIARGLVRFALGDWFGPADNATREIIGGMYDVLISKYGDRQSIPKKLPMAELLNAFLSATSNADVRDTILADIQMVKATSSDPEVARLFGLANDKKASNEPLWKSLRSKQRELGKAEASLDNTVKTKIDDFDVKRNEQTEIIRTKQDAVDALTTELSSLSSKQNKTPEELARFNSIIDELAALSDDISKAKTNRSKIAAEKQALINSKEGKLYFSTKKTIETLKSEEKQAFNVAYSAQKEYDILRTQALDYAKTLVSQDDIVKEIQDGVKQELINYSARKLLGSRGFAYAFDNDAIIRRMIETSDELQPFREGLREIIKNKTFKDYDEFLTYVETEVKANRLISDYENEMFPLYNLSIELYKHSSPVSPNVRKIRVNFGEIRAAVYDVILRRAKRLANSQQYGLNPNDVDLLFDRVQNIDLVLKKLDGLKQTFVASPVMEYNLDNPSQLEKFENLMFGVLGFSKDDVYVASINSTHKLPGVSFNNDTGGVYVQKTKTKYKTFAELNSKEANALTFKTYSADGEFISSAMEEIIRSVFPYGVVGINRNTKIKQDDVAFNVIPDFDINKQRLTISELAAAVIKLEKMGKSASATKGSAGFVYSTLGFTLNNDPQLVTYILLRNIAESVDFSIDGMKEQITDYAIKSGMSQAKLEKFGWIFEPAKKGGTTVITGFDKAKNDLFFKSNDSDTINIFEYLPVSKTTGKDNKVFIDLGTVGDKSGANTAKFVSQFYEKLVVLNTLLENQADNTKGVLPILKNVELNPIKIESGATFQSLIDKYKSSSNIGERALVATLSAAIYASEKYSDGMKLRFGEDKARRIMKLGELTNDQYVVGLLFDKQYNEQERLDRINEYLGRKSLNADPPKEIEATPSTGTFAIKKNIVYNSQIDYSKYSNPDNLIKSEDIADLKLMYASPYIDRLESKFASTVIDYKNRFIANVHEDENGFFVPVSNLIKMRRSDLVAEVGPNKLKLGTWIADTFGSDFYNDIEATLIQYDSIYPSRKVKALMPIETRVYKPSLSSPNMQADYRSVLGKNITDPHQSAYIEQLAKGKAENTETILERAQMEDDLMSAAEVGGQAKTLLSPFSEEQIKNVDDYRINPYDVSARTQVVNSAQKMAVIRQIQNAEAIRRSLRSSGIANMPSLDNEEVDLLTKQIVTLATINSTEKRKSSFILATRDAVVGAKMKFKTVMSYSENPYEILMEELIEISGNKKGSQSFIVQIDDGFTLRRPDPDAPGLKIIPLNDGSGTTNKNGLVTDSTSTMQNLLLTMFGEMWFKKLPTEKKINMTAEMAQQAMLEDFSQRARIQTNKNLVVGLFKQKLLDIGITEDHAEMLVGTFKRKTDEVSWTEGGMSFTESSVRNAYGSSGGDVFEEGTRNRVIKKMQGIVFDGIDMSDINSPVRKVLDSMFDYENGEYRVKNFRTPENEEKVKLAVNNIIYGIKEQMPRFFVKGAIGTPDYDGIVDVIKRYTLLSDNTALQKFAILSAHPDKQMTLLEMRQQRVKKQTAFPIAIKKTLADGSTKIVKDKLGAVLSDPNTTKIYFDDEWSYNNDERKPRVPYQVHFRIVSDTGTEEKTFWIRPEASLINDVRAANDYTSGHPYTKFNEFLVKNHKQELYLNLRGNPEAKGIDVTGKEIVAYLDGVFSKYLSSSDPTKKILFLGHNSKGKGSDIEVLRDAFNASGKNLGTEIVSRINGDGVAENDRVLHIDFLNDVTKVFFGTASLKEAGKNRSTLLALFARLPESVKAEFVKQYGNTNEAHGADYDAKMLEMIVANFDRSIDSGVNADTHALDYISDIFYSLTGKKLTGKDLKELSLRLKFDYDRTASPEFENEIRKYAKNLSNIGMEIKKSIVEIQEYFQRRIERVRQFAEIDSKVNDMTGYDSDFIRSFFESRDDAGALLFRKGLNILFGKLAPTPATDLDIDKKLAEKTFVTNLTAYIAKIYGDDSVMENSRNKNAAYRYTPKAFRAFYSAFVRDPEATINKFIDIANLDKTNKISHITKSDLDAQSVNNLDDAVARLQNNLTITSSFAEDSTIQSLAYKTAPLLNALVFSSDINAGTKEEIINQMFRLVSAVKSDDQALGFLSSQHIKDIVEQRKNEINFGGTTLSDYLKELSKQGFKDRLSSWGLYSKARETTQAQLDAAGLSSSVGKIFGTKAWIKNLLGVSLQEYKEQHGVDGSPLDKVFVSLKRDPSDKFDTYHAYEIIEDSTSRNQDIPLISMNRMELYSKHSGDFDGDAVTVYLPNDRTQKFYNGDLIQTLNMPYLMADRLMKKVYEWATSSGLELYAYDKQLKPDFTLQSAIAIYLSANKQELGKVLHYLKTNDIDQYNNFCFELSQKAMVHITDSTIKPFDGLDPTNQKDKAAIIQKVKDNFIDSYGDGGYFIHNKYVVDVGHGNLNKELFTGAYLKLAQELQFKSAINLRDQLSGMFQKETIRDQLVPTQHFLYNPFKFSASEMTLIQKYLDANVKSMNEFKAMLNDLDTLGVSNEAIGVVKNITAIDLYFALLFEEGLNRNSIAFENLIRSRQKDILGDNDQTRIEKEINSIVQMTKDYEKFVPHDFLGGKIFSRNKISFADRETIIDLLNNIDAHSNAKDQIEVVASEQAIQRGLGTKVKVLVDKNNVHKLNPDAAIPTKSFINDNYIYNTVMFNRFEKSAPDIKIPGANLLKEFNVGNNTIRIYKRKIDANVKIMAIGAGRSGKLTFSPDQMDVADYQPYDLIISEEQLKNLESTRSPNADVKTKIGTGSDKALDDVIIDGKKYGVIEYNLGVAEDIAKWGKDLKLRAVDVLSLVMNANSIGLIPFANGSLAKINPVSGEVEMNLDDLTTVFALKSKLQGKNFYEANFMSPYNQLRGIIAVDWILKHYRNNPEIVKRFTAHAASLQTLNQNWATATGSVNDIIREANEVSNGEFFSSLKTDRKNDPYGFRQRLYSYKLFEMSVGATFPFFDPSRKIKAIQTAALSDLAKETGISGKSSAFDKIYNDMDHQMVGASIVGEAPEAMIGGKPQTYLHMPAIQAMNFLLQGNEYISMEDVLNGVMQNIVNVGEALPPSLATGFVSLDANQVVMDPSLKVPASLQNYGVKTGAVGHIAGGIDVRPEFGFQSGHGVSDATDNFDNVYFDNIKPTTYKTFTERLSTVNGKIVEDGPILKNKGDEGFTNLRDARFVNAMSATINPNLSVEDRMLWLAGKHPQKFSATFGATNLDLDKGQLKNRASFASVDATTIADLKEKLSENYNLSGFFLIKDDIDKHNAELASKNFLTEGMLKKIKDLDTDQQAKLSEVEKTIREKQIELRMLKNDDEHSSQRIMDSINGDAENGGGDIRPALYRATLNSADIQATKIVYDPLHQTGLAYTGLGSYEVRYGIDKYHIGSKHHLMTITAPLQSIKQMLGNDSAALQEFEKFTQMRVAQLSYKEAMSSDDATNHKLANNMISDMGFINLDQLELAMTNYAKRNVGLVQLYSKTIANLETAAKDVATALNLHENINELFLLHPFMKKHDDGGHKKQQYFSTLNSVFLDQKPPLAEMIIKATQYNFGDSIYYLAANLSKVKAIEEAKEYFKRAGVLENSTVYKSSHDAFIQQLDGLDDSKKPHLHKTEKAEIIRILNTSQDGVYLNIDDNLVDSPKFFKSIYDRIVETKSKLAIKTKYSDMTIGDLTKAFNESNSIAEQSLIESVIRIEKMRLDFMADTIKLNKGMGTAIANIAKAVAESKDGVLTNEYIQLLPKEGEGSFSFLHGFDFKTIRDSFEYNTYGDNDDDRIAYMAISGNMYVSNKKLAHHLDKYFYTEKVPSAVGNIMNQTKGAFTKFIMSMPHKLLQRITQYSFGDMAQLTLTDPSCLKDMLPVTSETAAFFESKGATLKQGSDLHMFMETFGFNPFSYHNKSLNLDTFEYENSANLGKGYFAVAEKFFTAQTMAGRYALWKSLYKRFNDYDDTGIDKRLYGPVYSERSSIDQIGSNAEKAREIVYATLGGPNGFALLARKELNNIGMFLTFPMALLRTGLGHLKSVGASFSELIDGTANSATKRYLGTTALGLGGTQLLAGLFIAAISSFYGVDKKTEEEWKKKAVYIDPFLTLLNDRPIAITQGNIGLYAMLREMFYEPFEKADKDLLKGGLNWLSSNVIARLNPLFKTPLELITNKDFIGSDGPTDSQSRSFYDNLARKILSMFIGASGAIAMSDQWYYTKVGEEDPEFVKRLGLSLGAAVLGESGHFRGYKTELKNYYNALEITRAFKNIEQADSPLSNYNDNGFNLKQMSMLSSELKKAMDKEQPSSVIYGIIDEYIKDGASSSTIRAALFNNSISGKLSQIKDMPAFLGSLSEKNKVVLMDAIKYEEQHYSILKTIISDYISKTNSSSYKPKIYLPRNYYTYPTYDSNKHKSYYQYQNSWFSDKKWNDYAKQYFAYRAKRNFVPSLTDLTGKFAKDFYDYKKPRVRDPKGEVDARRYNENSKDNDDNSLYTNSKAGSKGR